jgi:hypothetical protein
MEERDELSFVSGRTKRLGRRGDRWRLGQWVFIFLGAQRSVMGDTVALTKTARIGNRKHGCFG